jgi:YcaO-like protein with predicted kinase domain
LRSRDRTPKAYTAGTHRTVTPEATLARWRPLLPRLGITRLADVTGLDTLGIPVIQAIRPNSRSLAVSQGKGLTHAAAQCSAIGEAAELQAAETILGPLLHGTAADLGGLHPLPLDGLTRASADGRDPATTPMLWMRGIDLLAEQPCWVPHECVHAAYTLDRIPPGGAVFEPTSCGLAAGNHPVEALAHALAELIERDAAGGRIVTADTQLDLDTVDDPGCRRVLDAYAAAEVAVGAWDLSKIGVPVCYAAAIDREEDPWRRRPAVHGSGCHPAREVALCRALTEAAQARAAVIAGAREDVCWPEYAAFQAEGPRARLRQAVRKNGAKRFQAVPTQQHDTLEEDVAWMLACLAAAGIRHVAVVDLTQNPRLPVVRVVVPGLRLGVASGCLPAEIA